MVKAGLSEKEKFLSTLPARGATQCRGLTKGAAHISIHAPREGSDTTVAKFATII